MENQQAKFGRRFTIEEDNYIKANYIFRDPNSMSNIAKGLNRTYSAIRNRITFLKLNNYTIHKDIPMKIKEPTVDTAFVLGVYLSDGSIYKNTFELFSIDEDYCIATLNALKNVLDGEFNTNITFVTTRHEKSQDGYKIHICSTDLCAWLITITESKQKIPQNFLDADKPVLLALMDGLICGDGFVGCDKKRAHQPGSWKIGLVGHSYIYRAVLDYAKVFDKLSIKYRVIHTDPSSPGMISYNLDKLDFINVGGYLTMKRKYNKLEIVKCLLNNLNEYHGTSEMDDGVL